jgi:hypothetical protein
VLIIFLLGNHFQKMELWEVVLTFLSQTGEVLPNMQQNPPANPLEGGAHEAPPLAQEPAEVDHADPHPHGDPDPRIGGESVSQIYSRLVLSYRGETLPASDQLMGKAFSILEKKGQILAIMEALDPADGAWLSAGGHFIKTQKGAEFSSLRTLHEVQKSLLSNGKTSPYFSSFMKRAGRPLTCSGGGGDSIV